MFLTVWLGIMLSGGPSGYTFLAANSHAVSAEEVRPAAIPPGPPAKIVRGLRNPDYDSIPKVPPPGAKITYSSVSIKEPYIAMTFDDGPHKTNTPRLLDLLKERNIKATFFLVGQCAHDYPDIVRRILAEGHELGNHTWDHRSLPTLSADAEHQELSKTDNAVFAATNYRMRLMRPPYGATNLRIKQECQDNFGYTTILWSVDPDDWKRPGVAIVEQRILAQVHPGAIILSHDIHEPTIEAMPDTLDSLLTKGYHFVTVSQLLNIASHEPPAPAATLAKTKAKAAAPTTGPDASVPTTDGSTPNPPPSDATATATPPATTTPPPTTSKTTSTSKKKKKTKSQTSQNQ